MAQVSMKKIYYSVISRVFFLFYDVYFVATRRVQACNIEEHFQPMNNSKIDRMMFLNSETLW